MQQRVIDTIVTHSIPVLRYRLRGKANLKVLFQREELLLTLGIHLCIIVNVSSIKQQPQTVADDESILVEPGSTPLVVLLKSE